MTDREHKRAIELISCGTQDIAASDLAWLEGHLELCRECAMYAEDCERTGQLLRGFAVTASSSLVASTQARVRSRAAELNELQSRRVLIAVSFCIGAMSSTMSAWLWWRFGGWLAERIGLSRAVVEPGVFVAWMLPAVVIAVIMMAWSHPVIDRRFTMEILGVHTEGGRS
jgi:hypothetical protein